MREPTYTQPDTVTDRECLMIIAGVVRGMGPITEEDCAPVVQKAIDMLHQARIDEAMCKLVIDGRMEISGINKEGDLLFRKSGTNA